jgi:hypothetical protein
MLKRGSKIYTAFWMPPDLREAAKARAEQQGRSLSNYFIQLARQDLGLTAKRKTEEQGKPTKKRARNGE